MFHVEMATRTQHSFSFCWIEDVRCREKLDRYIGWRFWKKSDDLRKCRL